MSIENYGYILDPTDRLFDDECLHHAATDNSWKRCPYPPTCRNKRRRPIQAGEGFRILGLDEYHNGNVSYTTDGNGWLEFDAQGQSPRYWLTYHECSPRNSPIKILAIRIPLEQEVKKDENKQLAIRVSNEIDEMSKQLKGGDEVCETNSPQSLKEVGISSHAAEVTKAAIINNEVNASNKRMDYYTQQQKDDFRIRALELMNTKQPLYRGQWIACEVEMPPVIGDYHIIYKGEIRYAKILTDITWLCRETGVNLTASHWLKWYPFPPLPAKPEREKEAEFEKAWENSELQNSMRSELNKEIFRQGWHASRAAMKGENV